MPKKDIKDYYEVGILGKGFTTGYYATTYREAIHDFLNDPTYDFPDGTYKVEVKGKGVHVVEKKTASKTTIKFK
jgi:hypothetical protein